MIRTTLAALAAATALAGAAGAIDFTTDSQTIDVSHVDFNNPTDVAMLYGEINDAARAVCQKVYLGQPQDFALYAPRSELIRQCADAAVRDAVGSAHEPALSHVYAMRGR